MYHTETLQQNQIKNPITKFTYTFRWGVDPNAFCAYAVLYSVWYVREGVLHLLREAPRVAAKMELQPKNGLHEFEYQP